MQTQTNKISITASKTKLALKEEIIAKAREVRIYQKVSFPDFDLKGSGKGRARTAPDLRLKLFENVDVRGKTIYDLGCSNGLFSFELAKRGAKVIGIDREKETIELNRLLASYYDLDITFLEEDLSDPDFYKQRMQEADITLFFSVMHHLFKKQKEDAIGYCREILATISQKSEQLYFECGQSGEPFSWSVQLGVMGLYPDEWIKNNWLSKTEYQNIRKVEPFGFEGKLGKLRKTVATKFRRKEFEPDRPVMRLGAYFLYRLFIPDSRETRTIFICTK